MGAYCSERVLLHDRSASVSVLGDGLRQFAKGVWVEHSLLSLDR
jgi:hypothetical protein